MAVQGLRSKSEPPPRRRRSSSLLPPTPPSHQQSGTKRRQQANELEHGLEQGWNALADREGRPEYQYAFAACISERGRAKIASWLFDIMDHISLDRSNAAVATALLDRYIASDTDRPVGSREIWLVVMACLHLSIKVHCTDRETFFLPRLVGLRRTCKLHFSNREVVEKELQICGALHWYLNPPVPATYINEAVPLLAEICNGDKLDGVVHLSLFLSELCVFDVPMCEARPSSVAHAAILVAMNHFDAPTKTVNRWLSLPLQHSTKMMTDRCILRLQGILEEHEDNFALRCPSPTSVEGASSETCVRA